MRRITSLTSALSFLVLIITSAVLYIVPPGRVAYWSDWRLWGLTKTQWAEIHTVVGFLFLLAGLLHIYYNWKPIMLYMSNKAKEFTLFTKPFVISFFLVLVCIIGTLAHFPPIYWVVTVSEAIKDAGTEKYGEPPYGHAELSSLAVFAKKMGASPTAALNQLKKAGLIVTSAQQTMLEIARANDKAPKEILTTIKPVIPAPDASLGLPSSPPSGIGKQRLIDIAQEYGLPMPPLLQALRQQGFPQSPELTLKELATAAGRSPINVYHLLLEVQHNK